MVQTKLEGGCGVETQVKPPIRFGLVSLMLIVAFLWLS
jgi:hypothetical protein